MENRTLLPDTIPEGTTCLITGTLVDETGAPVGSATITTFTMTLYCLMTGLPIINANNAINIKNANQGTLDASGNFTITLKAADNAIMAPVTTGMETHRMLLEWAWPTGKTGKYEIDLVVRNLDKV